MSDQWWCAHHIYLSDPVRSGKILVERIAPYAKDLERRGNVSKWFFVQYWDGGPHIRLRMQVREHSVADAVGEYLRDTTPDYLNPEPIGREAYYAQHNFDGEAVDVDALPWHGEGAVVALPYEPEYGRYGGERAMSVNESLFHKSSVIAASMTAGALRNPQALPGLALTIMAAAALGQGFSIRMLGEYFATYRDFWREYSEQTKAADLAGMQSDPVVVAMLRKMIETTKKDEMANGGGMWRQCVQLAVKSFANLHADAVLVSPLTGRVTTTDDQRDEAVASMMASQIHMFNNRLGVFPAQEIYLSQCLVLASRDLDP